MWFKMHDESVQTKNTNMKSTVSDQNKVGEPYQQKKVPEYQMVQGQKQGGCQNLQIGPHGSAGEEEVCA